jgi:tetratricopeptide (TPR) repeat protein
MEIIKTVVVPIAVAVISAFGAGFLAVTKLKDERIRGVVLITLAVAIVFTATFVFVGTTLMIDLFTPTHPTADILVVNFDGGAGENRLIDEFVSSQLDALLAGSPDINVTSDSSISPLRDRATADKLGYEWNANVVMWGWYATADVFYLQVHLAPIAYRSKDPMIDQTVQVTVETTPEQLGDFTLQKQLGHDLSSVAHGLYCYSVENWECAIENFTVAIENKSRNVFTYTDPSVLNRYRGAAYYFNKDYGAAVADIHSVLHSNPADPQSYYLLGLAEEMDGEPIQAMASYTTAADQYHFTEAYVKLALMAGKVGDHLQAVDYYEQAIALDYANSFGPENEDEQNILANAYLDAGKIADTSEDYETALKRFNRIISMDNKYYDAYYYRGLTYMHTGERDNAGSDFQYYASHGTNPDLVTAAKKYRWKLRLPGFLQSLVD